MAASRGAFNKGFTLIELVVGIIVMSIVLTIVVSIMAPMSKRSFDPIYQVKATELAQSLFNEIAAKAFDENRDPNGGLIRCGEDVGKPDLQKPCSPITPFELWIDEQINPDQDVDERGRDTFDDVDDFNGYSQVFNILDDDITEYYPDFIVKIAVVYVDDYLGTRTADGQTSNIKQITIIITTPNGLRLPFVRFRGNY